MKVKTITLALAMLALSVGLRAQQDPAIGPWKLNVAKSKYSPGPPPKSGTTRIEPYGKNGIRLTAETVNAQGNPTRIEWSAEFDGKDYPVKANPNADTVSLKRIDPYTVEITNKKAGKLMYTVRYVVGKDAKTRTVTTNGKNAQGQRIESVEVYEK